MCRVGVLIKYQVECLQQNDIGNIDCVVIEQYGKVRSSRGGVTRKCRVCASYLILCGRINKDHEIELRLEWATLVVGSIRKCARSERL